MVSLLCKRARSVSGCSLQNSSTAHTILSAIANKALRRLVCARSTFDCPSGLMAPICHLPRVFGRFRVIRVAGKIAHAVCRIKNFWGAYAAESEQGSSFQNSRRPDAALDWCDRARHRGWRRLLLRSAAEPCASRQTRWRCPVLASCGRVLRRPDCAWAQCAIACGQRRDGCDHRGQSDWRPEYLERHYLRFLQCG